MANYTLEDLDQIIGEILMQYSAAQDRAYYDSAYSHYADTGYIPRSFLDTYTGTAIDPNNSYRTLAGQQFDYTRERDRAINEFNLATLAEQRRATDLNAQLERELEAGRITRAQLEATVQRERIASEQRIAELQDRTNQRLADIQEMAVRNDYELGRGRLNLDTELGRRSNRREDFLANLQRAGMEAEMNANPRDFIKLAFLRSGQSEPAPLQDLGGNPTLPDALPQSSKGKVTKGPVISTVGEKGFEYALLAPGSIIAPSNGSEPNMRNAISALYNQLAKSGIDPNKHKDFQKASKGLVTADDGIVLPEDVTMEMVMAALEDAQNPRSRTAVDSFLKLKEWFPQFYVQGVDGRTPSTIDFRGIRDYIVNAVRSQPPTGDGEEDGSRNGDGKLPKEIGDIPFIKQLRSYTSPTAWVGTNNPYNGELQPINAYNPHVWFDIKNALPSDQQMALAYESSFGIPEDDFLHAAGNTAEGYGLTPTGARATFSPYFR